MNRKILQIIPAPTSMWTKHAGVEADGELYVCYDRVAALALVESNEGPYNEVIPMVSDEETGLIELADNFSDFIGIIYSNTDPNDLHEAREELQARNCQHEKPLKAQEEIEDIIADAEEDPDGFEWRYTTVSEFKSEYSSLSRYDVSQIGRALDKLGIMTERKRLEGSKTQSKVRRLPCHKYGCTLVKSINTRKDSRHDGELLQ